jgi:hypothetical protein
MDQLSIEQAHGILKACEVSRQMDDPRNEGIRPLVAALGLRPTAAQVRAVLDKCCEDTELLWNTLNDLWVERVLAEKNP